LFLLVLQAWKKPKKEKGSVSQSDLCIIILQVLSVAVDGIRIYRLTSGLLPSLASKREHVTPEHTLIGCKTWHDWSSNI